MSKPIIPILMAADDNYVKYLYVAILSMLENRHKDTVYDFYLLSPKSYSENIIKDFENLVKKYGNAHIHYVHMGNKFDNKEDANRFLPSATYYHLAIADIIKNHDRALYLDPDIIVLDDLTELFNTDLTDKYVAGVKAAGYMVQNNDKIDYYSSIGIHDIFEYTNASSLVWDLAAIRRDNITEKFYKYAKNIYPSQDQDVLNIVCYGKIKHIPLKYNMMVKYLPFDKNDKYSYDFLESVYGQAELKDAKKNPCVVHYANVNEKPWHTRVRLSGYWWKYAKKTPYYREFLYDYLKHRLIDGFKIKKCLKSICYIRAQKYGPRKYVLASVLGITFKIKRLKDKE